MPCPALHCAYPHSHSTHILQPVSDCAPTRPVQHYIVHTHILIVPTSYSLFVCAPTHPVQHYMVHTHILIISTSYIMCMSVHPHFAHTPTYIHKHLCPVCPHPTRLHIHAVYAHTLHLQDYTCMFSMPTPYTQDYTFMSCMPAPYRTTHSCLI